MRRQGQVTLLLLHILLLSWPETSFTTCGNARQVVAEDKDALRRLQRVTMVLRDAHGSMRSILPASFLNEVADRSHDMPPWMNVSDRPEQGVDRGAANCSSRSLLVKEFRASDFVGGVSMQDQGPSRRYQLKTLLALVKAQIPPLAVDDSTRSLQYGAGARDSLANVQDPGRACSRPFWIPHLVDVPMRTVFQRLRTCASAKPELEQQIEEANNKIAGMTEEDRHSARALAKRICELVGSWKVHVVRGEGVAQQSWAREAQFCYQAAAKIAEEYRFSDLYKLSTCLKSQLACFIAAQFGGEGPGWLSGPTELKLEHDLNEVKSSTGSGLQPLSDGSCDRKDQSPPKLLCYDRLTVTGKTLTKSARAEPTASPRERVSRARRRSVKGGNETSLEQSGCREISPTTFVRHVFSVYQEHQTSEMYSKRADRLDLDEKEEEEEEEGEEEEAEDEFHGYELKEAIGAGAYGEVWLATHEEWEGEKGEEGEEDGGGEEFPHADQFVLKRLYVEKGQEIRLSGMREVHFGLQLAGIPHVCRFIESFEEHANENVTELWLVFKFEDPFPDISILAGPPAVLAWEVMRQILQGVSFCHTKNVTHRDLKEETLDYAPPEVLFGDGVPCAAMRPHSYDLWSVGVIFLEMLLGTSKVFQIDGRTRAFMTVKMPNAPSKMIEQDARSIQGASSASNDENSPSSLAGALSQFAKQQSSRQDAMEKEEEEEEEEEEASNALQEALLKRDPLGIGLPDRQAVNLLRSLLRWNAEERISAEAALKHPYFVGS
ncbi:hypothetical protein GUITHDRAFT_134135 [Guillardia theta CCMP2712]|uniref:Protein kinase domain-containing protein n=1 Tax=Guillardia theta (strain CCMP2712) TaxID=905079 RepID=L1JUN1_GUITC|nr:hypothetical protein GUITHDRAFT_134135 [Guillardia theta CCMP2712]EKX51778.1 hypothetical protein GUITHDRAFT_134135 [Guillardia theta CCMP2712]|eukprot:XP_005838758.1 hypothetical protein GUITHDRAFT_134135 [Guillardia theta CCMP2712]